jgi:protein-tyrosine kinase
LSRNFELLNRSGIQELLQAQPIAQEQRVAHLPMDVVPSEPAIEMHGPVGDEVNRLVQNLFLSRGTKAPRRVVFSGTESGSGCTWVCAHAAEILASQVQGSVCVVDCNLRTPTLHEAFGVENHRGLSDLLAESGPIDQYTHQLKRRNLCLLSCGSSAENWQTLLASDRTRARLSELGMAFDYLLIDAAPMNTSNDAIVLGALADGVVLVLKANTSRRESARKVLQDLRSADVTSLGAVLNQRSFPIPKLIYDRL